MWKRLSATSPPQVSSPSFCASQFLIYLRSATLLCSAVDRRINYILQHGNWLSSNEHCRMTAQDTAIEIVKMTLSLTKPSVLNKGLLFPSYVCCNVYCRGFSLVCQSGADHSQKFLWHFNNTDSCIRALGETGTLLSFSLPAGTVRRRERKWNCIVQPHLDTQLCCFPSML